MSSENGENTCVVCFKNVLIYSIGECDHPVCYECSTRMRVLCRQNECPICRQDLPKVIFTLSVSHFRAINHNSYLMDKKFKICFETQEIQSAYNKLLEHACRFCPGCPAFRTFQNLKEHMRKEHELQYCELCVDNLMIFTVERRSYTRQELAQHRRKGDTDDRSHKGHPLCEFCDQRYMDNDELYRHLRRDHLFCHFCDADGFHHYYPTYDALRHHFRGEHYLCEEGDCLEEKFTPVFRSDIDLKAHRASVHGRSLGKAATKQARTLELEFTLAPRGRGERGGGERGTAPPNRDRFLPPPDEPSEQVLSPFMFRATGSQPPALTGANFPALNADVPGVMQAVRLSVNKVPTNLSIHVNHHRRPVAEDFPSLSKAKPQAQAPVQWTNQQTKKKPVQTGDDPFPGLRTHKASVQSKPKPVSEDHFPGLRQSSKKGNHEEQYTSVQRHQQPKVRLVPEEQYPAPKAQQPKNRPVLTNSEEQFPGLRPQASKAQQNEERSRQPKAKPASAPPPSIEEQFPGLRLTSDGNKAKAKKKKKKDDDPKENERKRTELTINNLAGCSNWLPPPPGFNNNGLTFTNSSGQSYSIVPTAAYHQPVDFNTRNQQLIQRVINSLPNDRDFSEFRQLSSLFRQGNLSASSFYTHCRETMGEDIIKEMLVLLPDIQKQQELYSALTADPSVPSDRVAELQVCCTCQQVIYANQMPYHSSSHHFPAL